ncbi:MAG: hypothetical protein HYV63_17405 [Candidatus Schekmanbacteria bacterium]|nr:hypothetical protein [Candidatus Schekmanbacteria bacterium]
MIHESDPVPLVAVVVFTGVSAEPRRTVVELAGAAPDNPAGKNWLEYVHMSRFVPGTLSDLFDEPQVLEAEEGGVSAEGADDQSSRISSSRMS